MSDAVAASTAAAASGSSSASASGSSGQVCSDSARTGSGTTRHGPPWYIPPSTHSTRSSQYSRAPLTSSPGMPSRSGMVEWPCTSSEPPKKSSIAAACSGPSETSKRCRMVIRRNSAHHFAASEDLTILRIARLTALMLRP